MAFTRSPAHKLMGIETTVHVLYVQCAYAFFSAFRYVRIHMRVVYTYSNVAQSHQ